MTATGSGAGGGIAARRAVMRWSLRLYRREWRQQVLICVLIALAVAVTILAAGFVSGSSVPQNAQYGTANQLAQLSGVDPHLEAEIASLHQHFGPIAVIQSSTITTGTAEGALLESYDPHAPFVSPLLQLSSGRFPETAHEVALSAPLASIYGVSVGDTWSADGKVWRVVGKVRAPTDLNAEVALVAPDALAHAPSVTVLFDASPDQLSTFRPPTAYYATLVSSIQPLTSSGFDIGAFIVLVAATFGMLFIGLIAVAGFTVMAQRRSRAIGMLGALGAAESQVRLVLLMNGFVLGLIGMVAGGFVGLVAWWVYAPYLQQSVGHVVDPAALPWWLVVFSLLLAPLTATLAAWRPARAAARQPVVASLSGRPTEPHASRRSAAIGISVLVGGLILVYASASSGGGGSKAPIVLLGIVATCVGLFLLAQWVVAQLGRVAAHAPLSTRIALRDLARYRSRSGAALGAICLAIVITGVVVVAATARYSDPFDYVGPNLAANVVMVYPPPPGGTVVKSCVGTVCSISRIADSSSVRTGQPALASVAHNVAGAVGASSELRLDQADAFLNRTTTGRGFSGTVYVATPALLAHYGISPSSIDPRALVLTARPALANTSELAMVYGAPTGPNFNGNFGPCPPGYCVPNPKIQAMPKLPAGTSAPNTVFTMYAVHSLHLTLTPSAYLLTTPNSLTAQQKQAARTVANGYSATIETASSFASLDQVLTWSIAIGMLIALGVLAMTVGLIRAETSFELRVLAATGAARRTRRALTAVTAAALGFVGAVLGVTTAYLLVVAFLANGPRGSGNLSELGFNLPLRPIGLLVLGLPAIAALGGWLFAAREPSAIARQPLG